MDRKVTPAMLVFLEDKVLAALVVQLVLREYLD